MTPDTPLYNSRLLKTYFDYLAKYYPDVDSDAILNYAGMTRYELEDGGHWFPKNKLIAFRTF